MGEPRTIREAGHIWTAFDSEGPTVRGPRLDAKSGALQLPTADVEIGRLSFECVELLVLKAPAHASAADKGLPVAVDDDRLAHRGRHEMVGKGRHDPEDEQAANDRQACRQNAGQTHAAVAAGLVFRNARVHL